MKLRKYRYGSSLRLQAPTFDEQFAKSNLLRQKHDAYNKAFLDAEKGLDFEYAAVDEPYVQKALQPLQQGLDNLSTNLATKGIKGVSEKDLLNYRRQYQKSMGPNGVLGKTIQNKAAMQQTLAEFDQVHAKDPEWYRQKAKQQMLAAYKGVKDSATGKLQDFTPGPVTGYRDIAGDAIEMLKNAGASDQDLDLFRSGHASIQPVTLPNGAQMLKIVEQTPGNIRSNKQQLEAGLNQLLTEYTDVNTDRGRFAQIAEYSPEYIAGSLSKIGNMMQSSVMSRQPGWNAGFQQMPDAPQQQQQQQSSLPSWLSSPFNFPQVNATGKLEENNKPLMKEADRLKELATSSSKPVTGNTISNNQFNSIMQKYGVSQDEFDRYSSKYPQLSKTKALSTLISQRRNTTVPELTNVDDVAFSKEESKQMIAEAKINYSNFYSEGMSDEEFLNNVSKELNDRAKVTDKLFSMNIKGYDALSRLNLKSDKQFTKKGSNKTYSLGDIYKQFQDEKLTHLYSQESPMFDDDLNIVIQGAKNDELYVMKPSEGVHKYYADNNKFLRGLENDDNITPEEMNEYRNTVIDLPGLNTKISFDFNKPDGKALQKEVIIHYPDSATPEEYREVKMPLKQFIEVTYKNAAQTAIFAQQTTPNE